MRNYERASQVGFSQESRERRESNRKSSADMLTANRIKFESKNNGAHLVIALHDRTIDFWPGTGLFTDRKTKKNGRGVYNLVKKIDRIKDKQKAKEAASEPAKDTA